MTTPGALRYRQTLGIYATEGRGFNFPVDMALGSQRTLYVLNRASTGSNIVYPRVTRVTLESEYLGEFSGTGTGDGQMMWPVSIAISADENLFVSDEYVHRISIFSKEGQFLTRWGTKGNGDGEFNCPSGLSFDKDGNLLVVDSVNNRIQRYSKDGTFLGGWGREGARDGEFNLPWGITVDQAGDVYVADWRNDRIQKFDSQGKHLATLGRPGRGDGEFNRPTWVAVDQGGNIYVTDWGSERVQVLSPDGSFLAKYRGESGISPWGEDYLRNNKEESEARNQSDLDPQLDLHPQDYLRNESANIEKLFWGPISVKVDDQGAVYVVENCRHRIQVYDIKA